MQNLKNRLFEKSYTPKTADESMKEKLKFTDIAGLESAKHQLTEIIDYIRQPLKYSFSLCKEKKKAI
jgi:ATP-dependent Zn protease